MATPRSALIASLLLALPCAGAPAARPSAGSHFAIRAKTVITISGADLSPGVVVVRDRKIELVGGADTKIPDGMKVIDAGQQVLMPGFIEAHSQRGLDRTFEVAPNSSFVRASDALNSVSLEIEDARRNGITTLLVAPDNAGFVSGRAAIVHPQGIAVDEMLVKDDAFLKISLNPGPGSSRMGHLARLREMLEETRRYMAERKKKGPRAAGRPRGESPAKDDDVEPQRVALVALLEGRMPAVVYCPTAADVSTTFALGREYGFRVMPVIGTGAWRAADLLRANNVAVVVTPQFEAWERLPDGSLAHVELAKILHDAGVSFALTTDPSALGAQSPFYQAALAVRQGVPRDEALEAITRVPARLLGFGNAKGVIAAGADADLVLLSDDPLSGRAWIDAAWILGRQVYDRSQDEKLKRLLSRSKEPPLAVSEVDHEDDHEDPDPSTSPPGRAPDEQPAGAPDDELERRWPVPPRATP